MQIKQIINIAIIWLMHDNSIPDFFFITKTLLVIETLSNIYFMAFEEETQCQILVPLPEQSQKFMS